MDKIFGEVDYVEAGEQETEAEKVETVTYEEAVHRSGSITSVPGAKDVATQKTEEQTVNEKV